MPARKIPDYYRPPADEEAYVSAVDVPQEEQASWISRFSDRIRQLLHPHELAPEAQEELLEELEHRWNNIPKHYNTPEFRKSREDIHFADVKAALENNPKAMWSLWQLQRTGGAPDVVGMEGDEYIFADCSAESPEGRRNLNWFECDDQSKEFGAEMTSQALYQSMQEKGEFDIKGGSWLKSDLKEVKNTNRAMFGSRNDYGVNVYVYYADNRGPDGWRASLRVKKA